MRRHICVTAWLQIALTVVAVGVAAAGDGTALSQASAATDLGTLALQGGFGAFVLAEITRWRELVAQLLRILDGALEDLREGRMTVRHEHVDIDGRPVDRRRPRRDRQPNGEDSPHA